MSNISLPPNLAFGEIRNLDSKQADVQVTASDILQDAGQIRQSTFKRPKQTIQDLDELRSYQLAKRREFEQQLNKNRLNFGQWMRYARWEIDDNHDFKRARSIMERALEVNVQHVPFWVRYIELELLHKNVNHARNLLDRAVTTLPRSDKLWFMYVQTEESLANYRGVRSVFERWITWKPPMEVWQAYIAFEQRYDEFDNARDIYVRFLQEFPGHLEIWQRWAAYEASVPPSDSVQIARIRGIFEAGIDELAQRKSHNENVALFVRLWAEWEASMREIERARAIYKVVLDLELLTKEQKSQVFGDFSEFERNHGVSDTDSTLRLKRLLNLEKNVAENPLDYDSWWELIKAHADKPDTQVIEMLEESVKTHPAHVSKLTSWRRYVFLWIKLAWYYEFRTSDTGAARATWKRALDTVSRQKFSFAKLWILYCEFELRASDDGLVVARKILGRAIGQTSRNKPKGKIFKHYISLEKKLGEWLRVRKLYERWLELSVLYDESHDSDLGPAVLKEYVAFESGLDESERCIGLYEAVIQLKSTNLRSLDVYLADYIEYLKDEMLYDQARSVYRQRIEAAPTSQMWVSFALFESQILSPSQMDELDQAEDEVQFLVENHHRRATRKIFAEAFLSYRGKSDAENAIRILDAWKDYESAHGTKEDLDKVLAKMPTEVKKRRTVGGIEESYVDYVFPETKPDISKFLANAKKWALHQ